jgi:hypothetical protein
MDDFDLDLRNAESEIDPEETDGGVVLGVLDGETDPAEWIEAVLSGQVLVLDVTGDLGDLAAPFADEVKDRGGTLMHFRGFLVVAPPGLDIDADRLD